MKLSDRIQKIEPSLTRDLYNKAKRYPDVIDFTLGDPDLMPPASCREAACQAIQAGQTHYSENAGLLTLRQAISNYNHRLYHIDFLSKNVIVTVGGMEAIFLALGCLLNPDDEVILIAPYWVNYVQMILFYGAKPVIVYSDPKQNFVPDIHEIEEKISSKTKLIILNNPSNPTGTVLAKAFFERISETAVSKNLYILSDDVYRSLIYEKQYNCIRNFPGMKERTILIDSVSKAFAMTGWRLGYAVAPEPLIEAMTMLQENVAACPPLPSQYAALAAYSSYPDTSCIRETFLCRRDLVIRKIAENPLLAINNIDATFYAFVNVSSTKLSSIDFAEQLLYNQHVAVVPGCTYGTIYNNYIRLAFTVSEEKINEGFDRIQKFTENLLKA